MPDAAAVDIRHCQDAITPLLLRADMLHYAALFAAAARVSPYLLRMPPAASPMTRCC